MQRGPKLSPDNELDYKYILTFTVAFVVIAGIILVAGYALLTATGILGQAAAGDPTPTSGPATPTHRPTYEVIILPTDVPCPTPTPKPATPTPTPVPTPTPSPYTVKIRIDEAQAGSYKYLVYISLAPGSQPLDMTRITLKISDWEKTYCDYNYDAAMLNLWGIWSNSNNDKILDPTEETLLFEISEYALDMPRDRETKLTLFLDGVQLCYTPLPALQNYVDLPPESPNPFG